MKIGDRDTPGSRIYAEREFRESAQILIATEAAGEGINLQFCWLMINYDIPWNPVRLEQRMGRIHRYGQEKDCLIFNFVTTNNREGRVLNKLFERIAQIELDLDPKQTGKVFNVLGEIFPANQLERMLREMYAHNNMTEELIKQRIIEEVDTERFRNITHSTLEGLAKRELNLSAIVGKSAEAKERRLVPEVIQDFCMQSAPISGVLVSQPNKHKPVYRIGKVPKNLWPIGERLEPRFGRLGREYAQVIFDKKMLQSESTAEWVTPGHPLFEAVRDDVQEIVRKDMDNGAVYLDLHRETPSRLNAFSAAIKDGRGNVLHRRLFVVEEHAEGSITIRQPTVFLDLMPATASVESVEADNRGFDLISRKPHTEDPKTALEVRFIEVKGRAFVGEVALTTNEYKTAQRLGKDYWLYVVFNCGSTPELRIVQDPAQLAWEPLVKIEHYWLAAKRLDPHKLLDQ